MTDASDPAPRNAISMGLPCNRSVPSTLRSGAAPAAGRDTAAERVAKRRRACLLRDRRQHRRHRSTGRTSLWETPSAGWPLAASPWCGLTAPQGLPNLGYVGLCNRPAGRLAGQISGLCCRGESRIAIARELGFSKDEIGAMIDSGALCAADQAPSGPSR
jgi:hypothetical protein